MRRTIRLTESELRRMISESVRSTLNEQSYYDDEERYSNSYRECIRLLKKAQLLHTPIKMVSNCFVFFQMLVYNIYNL